MTVLSDQALTDLASNGMVKPFDSESVSPCSIDLRLGSQIQVESLDDNGNGWVPMDITAGYLLKPKQFVLAHTRETVTIPDGYSGQILLRSSAARAGFNHALSGWCDPGFSGQITLELTNQLQLHDLRICAGQRLLQLIIFGLDTPPALSYELTGNYQNQTGATISNLNF